MNNELKTLHNEIKTINEALQVILKLVGEIRQQQLSHLKEQDEIFQDFKNQELYGNEGSEKYFEELNR